MHFCKIPKEQTAIVEFALVSHLFPLPIMNNCVRVEKKNQYIRTRGSTDKTVSFI